MQKHSPDPEQWYSLLEASKFTPVKSREILTLHIRNGFLQAKSKGKGPGKRYLISGKWILDYLEHYNHKQNKYARFVEFRDVPINHSYEKYENPTRRKRKRTLVSLPASDKVSRGKVSPVIHDYSGSVSE